MPGKRQNDVNMVAVKGDIVKDIIADTISKEIHHETGIACSKRENSEIRVNIIKLENLVKQYDLNNPEKEVPLYEGRRPEGKKVPGLTELKTYKVIKEELEARKQLGGEWRKHGRKRKKSIGK